MREIEVMQIDSFTSRPLTGNPAGLVIDAGGLTEQEMLAIAREMNCSETAFVTKSRVADFRVRFFSPKREVDLCGHATIATFFTLASEGIIPLTDPKTTVTQETNVGVLQVHIFSEGGKIRSVMMEQNPAEFKQPDISAEEVADALNILPMEINPDLPIECVSTGLFSLKVPITKLSTIAEMKPDFRKVLELCNKAGAGSRASPGISTVRSRASAGSITVGSLHVWTLETVEPDSTVHCRNFAPVHGVNEDPVTGTASGALGAYLVRHGISDGSSIIMEQGYEINRPGKVHVTVGPDTLKVQAGGMACPVLKGKILLP